MKEKSILICLDRLDIGGVETFVCSQVEYFIKKGYMVTTLSKEGIYTEKLKKIGCDCVNFEFDDKVYSDYNKIKQIMEIIKSKKITEVHINQFSEISYVMPACILTNTPYIAYLHAGPSVAENKENSVYNWFEKINYNFKDIFSFYLNNAYMIIGITKQTLEYTLKRYNVTNKKCMVIHNSINMDNFCCKTDVKKLQKFLIVSRLSEEKISSIYTGLEIYNELQKNNFCYGMELKIVGDGNQKEKIENKIKELNVKNVIFVGASSNIKEYIEQSDILMGIGRCILEAMSMKRIAIICGINKNSAALLTSKNIEKCFNENFGGKSLKENNIQEITGEIKSLSEADIEKIVNDNFNFVKENLDVNKNIFTIEDDLNLFKYDCKDDYIQLLIKNENSIGNNLIEEKNEKEKIWKEHIEYQIYIENKLENQTNELKGTINQKDKNIKILEDENNMLKNESIFDNIRRKMFKNKK